MDDDDFVLWMVEAGSAAGYTSTGYIFGDGNLDGVVDLSDFNIYNSHKSTHSTNYCDGDYNLNGVIDVADYDGVWESNKFNSSRRGIRPDGTVPSALTVVPEPPVQLLAMILPLFVAAKWPIRRPNKDSAQSELRP